MRTSIWYHSVDQNPNKSGHYLCYRGFGMGGMSDSDHSTGYLWYDKGSDDWYDYEDRVHSAIVYYWTDSDPENWVDTDPPVTQRKKVNRESSPALKDAWKKVQEAINQYEMIRTLLK